MKILFRNLGIAFTLTVISVFINHALGFNTVRHDIGEITRNAVTILFWCSIFLTIVQMRARAGAEHNFLIAFRNGFFYTIFFSALFALFIMFYQKYVNADFYPTYRAYFANQLAAQKLSPEIIASKLRMFDMSFDGRPATYMLLFLFMAMGGVILAAIAAVIYRKPKLK